MFGFNWKTFEKSGESFSAASGGGAPPERKRRPRIGLALGSGAARGWSHIGVLQELEARKVQVDVIAGASMGAVVGGCYAAGRLAALETFARSLTKRRVFSLMDVSFSGAGMLTGGKLRDELARELSGRRIENLPITFGAVATEIGSGHEVWLRKGDLVQAIRASYALPGIFEPLLIDNRWLFDGDVVTLGATQFEVYHCPGHTPGHVIFFHREGRFAQVGDVLFAGSVGRTDQRMGGACGLSLPDPACMRLSIRPSGWRTR